MFCIYIFINICIHGNMCIYIVNIRVFAAMVDNLCVILIFKFTSKKLYVYSIK